MKDASALSFLYDHDPRDENGRENILTIPAPVFFGREREIPVPTDIRVLLLDVYSHMRL